jgi:hypothetical protein
VNSNLSPSDLDAIATRYAVPRQAVLDLILRRRAGAHDAELIDLLSQRDWGGLDEEHATQLVSELPR